MGFKQFVNNTPLLAEDLNEVSRQSVMRFATAGDRTAQITTPTKGMMTFLDSTNRTYQYNGTTWVELMPTNGIIVGGTRCDSNGKVGDNVVIATQNIVLPYQSSGYIQWSGRVGFEEVAVESTVLFEFNKAGLIQTHNGGFVYCPAGRWSGASNVASLVNISAGTLTVTVRADVLGASSYYTGMLTWQFLPDPVPY